MAELQFICDGSRHLICIPYAIDNLHKMAEQLGIGRHFFHNTNKPHYDIPAKRVDEITEQCQKVGTRELIGVIRDAQDLVRSYNNPRLEMRYFGRILDPV